MNLFYFRFFLIEHDQDSTTRSFSRAVLYNFFFSSLNFYKHQNDLFHIKFIYIIIITRRHLAKINKKINPYKIIIIIKKQKVSLKEEIWLPNPDIFSKCVYYTLFFLLIKKNISKDCYDFLPIFQIQNYKINISFKFFVSKQINIIIIQMIFV